MVLIPAGEFTMGSDEQDTDKTALNYGIVKPWFEDEHPARKINLPAYYIDKYEVTNQQYAAFLKAANYHPPRHWNNGQYPTGQDQLPINGVTWDDANSYCTWAGKAIPTEAQWEKAARGTDGRIYPWGNEFDPKKANIGGGYGGLKPVGSFEEGKSPYGVYDMIGNAWEWTADWYEPYPGNNPTNEFFNNKFGHKYKSIRGNSWSAIGHYSAEDAKIVLGHYSRIPYRLFFDPKGLLEDVGFRCVKPA
jgi:formylglycine-generating enzyme required for sulfatase activity